MQVTTPAVVAPAPPASTSAAAPATPAPASTPKPKTRTKKRLRSDSISSSRPQSPAAAVGGSAIKQQSNSNKRQRLCTPVPTASTSKSNLPGYPLFLSLLAADHPPLSFPSADLPSPLASTIQLFLTQLRGTGRGGEQETAMKEVFKAVLRIEGLEGEMGRMWDEARREVRKATRKGKKVNKKGRRKGAEGSEEDEREETAAVQSKSQSKGKGKAKESLSTQEDAMDVDVEPVTQKAKKDEQPSSSAADIKEQQLQADTAALADKLARKQAKRAAQELKRAEAERLKKAEDERKLAAAAAVPLPSSSPPAPAAKALPPPPPSVPVPAPTALPLPAASLPNGVASAAPKSSPAKPVRNRLGKREKEELRRSSQSAVPTISAPATAAPIAKEVPVVEAVQEQAQPQADVMEVDEEVAPVVAASAPAEVEAAVEAAPEKMDVDAAPASSPAAVVNGDLSSSPEPTPAAAVPAEEEEVDGLLPTQDEPPRTEPAAVVASPSTIFRAASVSMSARPSVASSEEDPEELALSLREHCSPARKTAELPVVAMEEAEDELEGQGSPTPRQEDKEGEQQPQPSSSYQPAPISEDLYAPPSAAQPSSSSSISKPKPEEVPLPPSRSASPEEEDERAAPPPPLRRHETIGGNDDDSDSSSSDDSSSDEQSSDDELVTAAPTRPKVKRTSLSAISAAAFGKPGTPRARSGLGQSVTSPRRNLSQLSNGHSQRGGEEDEFDQLLSQSQPRKRLSLAHVLPDDSSRTQTADEREDEDDGASSHFSPVASSVEGTPRAGKGKARAGRESSEEPDTVDEDEAEDRTIARDVVAHSAVNGEDALSSPANAQADPEQATPTSSAMVNGHSTSSQPSTTQPRQALLTAIGSVASSQAGELPEFEVDTQSQAQRTPVLPEAAEAQEVEQSQSQWEPVQKDAPLFLETQEPSQSQSGAGESQLREVEGESMDPLDQTQSELYGG